MEYFKKFVRIFILFIICGPFSSCDQKSSEQEVRPNILFIMTDDHARQAVSSYGSQLLETPNIDRIAKEGMLFRNSFVTNSICAPSRAVILTGKYSHLNGVTDNRKRFDGSQVTFPKLLQKAGYETAMIGKWHLKTAPTGFDYWKVLPGQGFYYNPVFIEMGDTARVEGYVTDLTTDFALDWLEQREDEKPFCLMLHQKAPHREWSPALRHLNLFDDVQMPEPENLFDTYETRGDAARQQAMTIAHHMNPEIDLKIKPEAAANLYGASERGTNRYKRIFSRLTPEQLQQWDAAYEPKNQVLLEANLEGEALVRWKYQRYIKDYLRCIVAVDENVGRVLDYLDENGLTENTLIVYTSDQGFYLGEHGWFDKRFMYEESLSMPLVARYPKVIPSGSTSDEIVLNLDFAPTFLDFAGIKVPSEMQGMSLRPLLEGTNTDWRTAMYYHYYEYPGAHSVKRHYGIRTKQYKLMHFYNDIDQWELYDLEKDPLEMDNIYKNEEYKGAIKELKDELSLLMKKYREAAPTSQ